MLSMRKIIDWFIEDFNPSKEDYRDDPLFTKKLNEAIKKLAKLYSNVGDNSKSAYYYKMSLDRLDANGVCITMNNILYPISLYL